MDPKISIIVPVYNVENYLNRCVDSIINQTYKNLEIILVNDGSPDNCGEICNHYAEKDSRITVIHQENQGLSGARNSGLKIASGDYIGFVDSDDWIEPNMYQSMLAVFKKHNTDIVECGLFRTHEVNSKINRSGSLIFEDRLEALRRIIKNQDFSVWRRLYQKKTLQGLLFIEGKNSEDVYFTIDVFKNINQSVYISNLFYNYFIGGDSITRGKYKLKILDSIDAALYLQEKVCKENDNELIKVSNIFVLDILLINYKLINYNYNYDVELNHRRRIKGLIKKNYFKNNNAPLHLKLARYLPIRVFNFLIRLNASLKTVN